MYVGCEWQLALPVGWDVTKNSSIHLQLDSSISLTVTFAVPLLLALYHDLVLRSGLHLPLGPVPNSSGRRHCGVRCGQRTGLSIIDGRGALS
jgi:hypothetical protein